MSQIILKNGNTISANFFAEKYNSDITQAESDNINNRNCYNCYSCNYCNSCNFCDSCDYCYSCNYCNSCDYCNYCKSCDSCNFSKNLKMSEYQICCYAEKYGSQYADSYQQKIYRICNAKVTEDEYSLMKIPEIKPSFDRNESCTTRYQTSFKIAWGQLLEEEKQQFLDSPHFDSGIFFKITGVDVTKETINEMTVAEIEAKLGIKNLKIVK